MNTVEKVIKKGPSSSSRGTSMLLIRAVGGRLKKGFLLATVQICQLATVLDPKNGNSFRKGLDKALE